MNNEIKINVPEGMEIDKENSTFECIKFKPKWVPKRGDIAVAGSYMPQIILIGEYIEKSTIIGFDIMCLAVLNTSGNHLTIWEQDEQPLWVEREASATEKALFIKKLNEQGYVYDQNDPRIIYKKEKELPKTWEEFCENNPIKPNEYFINTQSDIAYGQYCSSYDRNCVIDANLLPSREYAEAMLALCKLIQLRDCYNDGWKPDWSDKSKKHCIFYNEGNVELFVRNSWSCILVFKSRELRNEFYNNFKDLIEQAKLLL
jgi:hypothetical protein